MTRGTATERTDEQLLAAHVGGEGDAFRVLYERHKRHLWAVALRTTGNHDDAADALQDALISIHRTAITFRSDSSVSSWLHKIVVNASLDRRRRDRSHETLPLLQYDTENIADVHNYTEEVDLSLSIGRALDVLPPDQRDAVVLVDLHGYSIRDAASTLRIASGTVKSRCSRGREKLALVLEYLRDDY